MHIRIRQQEEIKFIEDGKNRMAFWSMPKPDIKNKFLLSFCFDRYEYFISITCFELYKTREYSLILKYHSCGILLRD